MSRCLAWARISSQLTLWCWRGSTIWGTHSKTIILGRPLCTSGSKRSRREMRGFSSCGGMTLRSHLSMIWLCIWRARKSRICIQANSTACLTQSRLPNTMASSTTTRCWMSLSNRWTQCTRVIQRCSTQVAKPTRTSHLIAQAKDRCPWFKPRVAAGHPFQGRTIRSWPLEIWPLLFNPIWRKANLSLRVTAT